MRETKDEVNSTGSVMGGGGWIDPRVGDSKSFVDETGAVVHVCVSV